jgi:CHAT domain-containing protein
MGELSVSSPDDGFLRVRVEERGISVVVTADDHRDGAAESPVERLGTIQLLQTTRRGQRHSITIRAEDSPDISGEFCVRADLISATDSERVLAEKAFESAGRATHNNDWDTAFDEYLNAARRFDHLGIRESSATARQALAEIAYLRLDRKRDSYALASQALADYGDHAEPFEVGSLISLQSKALLDMPGLDVRAAAPQVRKLQEIAGRYFLADPVGARELPRLNIMAGFLAYQLDAPGRARALFSSAAQTCKTAQDWDCYAIATQNLALAEYESRNYTVALSAFADVLRLLPPGLDPKLSADIWNNYGLLQGLMGLHSNSERSQATAMREFAQLGDCQGVRRSLAQAGNLLVQLGSLSDAMSDLQQAATLDCAGLLTAEAAQPSVQPMHAAAIGISSTRRNAYTADPRGEPWCTQTLDPAGLAVDNKFIVFSSLVSLGDALMLEGEPQLAQRCLDVAGKYAATARMRVRLANARGDVLLERQDAAAAHEAFQQAIVIADEAKIPGAHEYRGRAQLGLVKTALLSGNSRLAVNDGLVALQASVTRADVDQTVASLRLLAAGYRGTGQSEQAAHTLETAANLVEAVPIDELDGEKRATYLATQYKVFSELTDLYAAAADKNPRLASMAFATSERGRARSLRFAVSQAESDAASAPERPPVTRYQQLLKDLASFNDSRGELTQTALIDSLDAAAASERKADEPFDQQQLQKTLTQLHATLVEYAAGVGEMLAFVVNESGLHITRLGDRQKIASAAAELHDRLMDAETPADEVRRAAQRLAQLILWPLTPQLSGKRIVVVPDEGLHTIPFNVLPWSSKPSDLLVLQHAEVSIAPSAQFLTRVRATSTGHSSAPRIELLGDPVFRISDWRRECTEAMIQQTGLGTTRSIADWTESLPPLPGSRAEVEMVARLSQQNRPTSRVEIFLGCAAVPAALRRAASGHVDLLHIATHARVDSQRPRLSALALTPEHRGDTTTSAFGLLDILSLKLSSSLVVLSACETSRGRLLPGEGVLGPAQAFLQAGAGAVVASYWRIDDLATSQFMQQFYRYLLAERLPAATALRKAQMEAAQTSSSHDWAAFSLYGWPDSSI